jgi:hypothetical protein
LEIRAGVVKNRSKTLVPISSGIHTRWLLRPEPQALRARSARRLESFRRSLQNVDARGGPATRSRSPKTPRSHIEERTRHADGLTLDVLRSDTSQTPSRSNWRSMQSIRSRPDKCSAAAGLGTSNT